MSSRRPKLAERPCSRENFLYSQVLDSMTEAFAINAVAISKQIAGALSLGNTCTTCCAVHSPLGPESSALLHISFDPTDVMDCVIALREIERNEM